MRFGILVAAGVAVSLLIGVASGRSVTALVAPVADTYVSAAQPTRNFGTAESLRVSAGSAAYLRFRVSVPAGETVTRATLQLFPSAKSSVGFTVHGVANSAWSERKIAFRNVPTIQRRAIGSSGPYRGNAFVSVDVTQLVTRSGAVSFALKAASSAPLAFKSREAGVRGPRLVVKVDNRSAYASSSHLNASCGTLTGTPRGVDHVIWIWMENKSYGDVIGSPSAQFENQLAGQCGL